MTEFEEKHVAPSVFYDVLADNYQKKAQINKRYLNSIDDLLIKNITLLSENRFLDIGTGDGVRYHNLQQRLKIRDTFYAVEESSRMAEMASVRLPATIIINDRFENQAFAVKFTHVLALWNVIGHVPDLNIFFQKLSAVLTDDGAAYLDCVNPLNLHAYGVGSVLKNHINIFLRKKEFLEFEISSGETRTIMRAYSEGYLRDVLTENSLFVSKRYFVNYSSGELTNIIGGQRFFEIKRIKK